MAMRRRSLACLCCESRFWNCDSFISFDFSHVGLPAPAADRWGFDFGWSFFEAKSVLFECLLINKEEISGFFDVGLYLGF